MLALDLKTAAAQIGVAKRTLTEFESGIRTLNVVTADKIEGFYRSMGVMFGRFTQGDDAVSYLSRPEPLLEPDVIKPKVETANLIDIHSAVETLTDITNRLNQLQDLSLISRNVLRSIVSDLGVERVEIATRLGVTPSFVSAILMGQKLLPVSHAEAIREILNLENPIQDALQSERRIKRLLAAIRKLVDEANSEIKSIIDKTREI